LSDRSFINSFFFLFSLFFFFTSPSSFFHFVSVKREEIKMENKKRLSSSVFVFLPFYLSYYINDMFHIGCKSESNFYFNVGQDYDDLSSIYYRSDKHRMAADERKRPGSKSRCHFIPPDCARGSDTSIENNTAGNTYRNRKIKRVREREEGG
jgi:hypothetical protein